LLSVKFPEKYKIQCNENMQMTGHWAKRVEVWGSTCFYLLLPIFNEKTVMVADTQRNAAL